MDTVEKTVVAITATVLVIGTISGSILISQGNILIGAFILVSIAFICIIMLIGWLLLIFVT
jgi:hypothetical protein